VRAVPTRQEVWEAAYLTDPYMRRLTNKELDQRAADIFSNFGRLTLDGKLGCPNSREAAGAEWIVRLSNLFQEYNLRGAPFPAGLTADAAFPHPSNPKAKAAARTVRDRALEPGIRLFKYGRLEHLRAMVERGELRISPASSYNDPSLNHAMQDDELTFVLHPDFSRLTMTVYDQHSEEPKRTIRPIDGKITKRSTTNFYVYCLAETLAPRLFVDFEADACLIIHNPTVFIDRLCSALQDRLPGWRVGVVPVQYVDPLLAAIDAVSVLTCKHLRFSYQHEKRIVALPPSDRTALDVIHPLFVPSLGKDCEILELEGTTAPI
jgi:hypothetical protein